jgi:hypothetical protein
VAAQLAAFAAAIKAQHLWPLQMERQEIERKSAYDHGDVDRVGRKNYSGLIPAVFQCCPIFTVSDVACLHAVVQYA